MEEAATRRRQAIVAGHNGDPETAKSLLSDPDPAVRASALSALERLGALEDDLLRRALADPSPAVRRQAVRLAATHPSVSVVVCLADEEPLVAEMAAWAIGEQGARDEDHINALADVARGHDDPLCREAAVAALGALQDERGLPAILQATTDKPAVRRRAVLALAPFEGHDVDAALERALSDRDWQVRQAAEDLSGR